MLRKDHGLARGYHRLLLQIMCFYVWIFLPKKQCLVPTFHSTSIRRVSSCSWSLGRKGQKRPASFLGCERLWGTFQDHLRCSSTHILSRLIAHSFLSSLCSSARLCLCFLCLQLFLQVHSLSPPDPIQTMPSPVPAWINPHLQCIPTAFTSWLSCYTPGYMLLKIRPGVGSWV